MSKKWAPLIGFEKHYLVSTDGRIISIARKSNHSHHVGIICSRKQRELKFSMLKSGYLIAALTVDGLTIRKTVHRLVAKTFIPNPENKPCVNHKNGIKSDNRKINLEWATYKENTNHAYKTGLLKPSYGMLGKIGKKNKRSKKVQQINIKTGKVIKIWDSLHCITRAKKTWSYSNISSCASGKRPTAYGFKWKFL